MYLILSHISPHQIQGKTTQHQLRGLTFTFVGFEHTSLYSLDQCLTTKLLRQFSVGIDTLCQHNFEHIRYIWEFENNARIIGRNSGIIRRYPSANTTLNAHVQ